MYLGASISYNENGAGKAEKDRLALQEAVGMYNRITLLAELGKFWHAITRRPEHLKDLESFKRCLNIKGSHSLGMRAVPIKKIHGSEGRAEDFDASFRPLNERTRARWQGIAGAVRTGRTLPPVELVQVGEEYYVRDGHHRISVLKTLGQVEVDAEVTVLDFTPGSACRDHPALA
jgi:hypothetical protein